MTRIIFGCGYLGQRVADAWLRDDPGRPIFALTRSERRAGELRARGLTPLVGDVTAPDCLPDFPFAETVLYAIGHDRRAGPSLRSVYVDGLAAVLARLPSSVTRFVYVSSTGVYGAAEGAWVDERTPCEPTRENGRVCLDAERLIQASSVGERAVILRLAGLYGPGRVPRIAALRAGEPIAAPEEGWLNLIHVDDAVEVVLAAERRAPPRLYAVSDGSPCRRGAYYEDLARLIEAPPPRFVTPPAESAAADRALADKRVSNARMLDELGVVLRYPTHRDGLRAIVGGGQPPTT